jgi:hypothetical protein
VLECLDLSSAVPKLDVMDINELLRSFLGRFVIRAFEIDRTHNAAVWCQYISSIIGHAATERLTSATAIRVSWPIRLGARLLQPGESFATQHPSLDRRKQLRSFTFILREGAQPFLEGCRLTGVDHPSPLFVDGSHMLID